MKKYIVATIKPWNIAAFHQHAPNLSGEWHLLNTPDGLSTQFIENIGPRYIFFPHWSWRVPKEILNAVECVCFHMTDVPYGRGGSPLQNLISRGHKETKLTALRMASELDAGPVYLKRPLSLVGRAEDIFERAAELVYDMIAEIIEQEPQPVPQEGEVTEFKRRTPNQSVLPTKGSLSLLYDHIRMLDAQTYPRAFIDHGEFRMEFSDAQLTGDEVQARVVLRRKRD